MNGMKLKATAGFFKNCRQHRRLPAKLIQTWFGPVKFEAFKKNICSYFCSLVAFKSKQQSRWQSCWKPGAIKIVFFFLSFIDYFQFSCRNSIRSSFSCETSGTNEAASHDWQHICSTLGCNSLLKMVSEGEVSAPTLCDVTKCQLSELDDASKRSKHGERDICILWDFWFCFSTQEDKNHF